MKFLLSLLFFAVASPAVARVDCYKSKELPNHREFRRVCQAVSNVLGHTLEDPSPDVRINIFDETSAIMNSVIEIHIFDRSIKTMEGSFTIMDSICEQMSDFPDWRINLEVLFAFENLPSTQNPRKLAETKMVCK